MTKYYSRGIRFANLSIYQVKLRVFQRKGKRVFIVKNTFLRRLSPTFLTFGSVSGGLDNGCHAAWICEHYSFRSSSRVVYRRYTHAHTHTHTHLGIDAQLKS